MTVWQHDYLKQWKEVTTATYEPVLGQKNRYNDFNVVYKRTPLVSSGVSTGNCASSAKFSYQNVSFDHQPRE
jgi:cytolysin (calcineurin-like family phosphatase)